MCLTATSGILIAERDIICFKNGKISLNTFDPPYNHFLYYKGKRTKEVMLYCARYSSSVYEGYHTYNKLSHAEDSARHVGIFIIPKGEKYIEGYFSDKPNRVSSSLIYFGEYNWWNRWRLKKKYGRNCLETLK